MRNRFDKQLDELNRELIEMGALCEEAISTAAKALTSGNVKLAKNVFPIEKAIDDKERIIESHCLKMLLQQQPVAKDLRQISAALKMITDMERIGDQAADIAEIIGFLDGRTGAECQDIAKMAIATTKMVTDSIDAYVKQDLALAEKVMSDDDTVDDLFDIVKKALICMISKDASDGEYSLDLLMISKYFERIGDHAVNIAEWVEFSMTGIHRGQEE